MARAGIQKPEASDRCFKLSLFRDRIFPLYTIKATSPVLRSRLVHDDAPADNFPSYLRSPQKTHCPKPARSVFCHTSQILSAEKSLLPLQFVLSDEKCNAPSEPDGIALKIFQCVIVQYRRVRVKKKRMLIRFLRD